MTIEIDATEARRGTKLPGPSAYHAVTGLESLTGADILVHPFRRLPNKIRDVVPHRAVLTKACKQGILIQRKSGADLLSSVGDLREIIERMGRWSPNPWLLITCLYETKKSRVGVRGSRRSYSHWRWENLTAATDMWKVRGGSVTLLYNDARITRWLEWCEVLVGKILEDPTVDVVKKTRFQAVKRVDENWVNTGRAWPPGIGLRLLENLARYVTAVWKRPPTLVNCMALAHDQEVLMVPLWGKKRLADVRQWTGSGGRLMVLDGETYVVGMEKLGTVGDPIQIKDGIVLKGE